MPGLREGALRLVIVLVEVVVDGLGNLGGHRPRGVFAVKVLRQHHYGIWPAGAVDDASIVHKVGQVAGFVRNRYIVRQVGGNEEIQLLAQQDVEHPLALVGVNQPRGVEHLEVAHHIAGAGEVVVVGVVDSVAQAVILQCAVDGILSTDGAD